jgi:hypothetical protein
MQRAAGLSEESGGKQEGGEKKSAGFGPGDFDILRFSRLHLSD